METEQNPLQDRLAATLGAEPQRQAARMAQDAFARLFSLTLDGDDAALAAASAEIARRCANWARAGGDDEARALRLALLLAGVDQWGLAWCQAFRLSTIPAVTRLLGELRTGLDAADDARLQRAFAAIEAGEGDAIDFKMELRRHIHLGLWHAMVACEQRDEAQAIGAALGGMMLALTRQMPTHGWRLVADALAHIQMRCLAGDVAIGDLARDSNDTLFEALRRELPPEQSAPIFALANQAALAWQQARRATMN